ncbi:MAG: hypothetical protein AAFX05_09295 [Planctomycetota bacterium]
MRANALHVRAGAVIVGMACIGASALGAVPAYQLVGQFELPTAAAFDVLPDGRALLLDGTDIKLQDSLHASTYTTIGSIPGGLIPASPSFFSVSPDGARVAIGDNQFNAGASVHVFDVGSFNTVGATTPDSFVVPNFDAHWSDNDTLFVSGSGATTVVTEIRADTLGVRTVIDGVGGASGGVTTDGTHLYTGNGFAFGGPSATGEVKAFLLADIDAAVTAIDFEASGVSVADDLSGGSLGFDSRGNFLVGGGDFFGTSGDFGYFAVYDDEALDVSLAGGGIMSRLDRLTFTPNNATDSYTVQFNEFTDELLVTFFDNTTFTAGTTVFRYQVPTPGAAGMLALLGIGGLRRRARAA